MEDKLTTELLDEISLKIRQPIEPPILIVPNAARDWYPEMRDPEFIARHRIVFMQPIGEDDEPHDRSE